MKMFGDVDRNQRGELASEMPAWTMKVHCEKMKEEINSMERRLERGEVPPEHRLKFENEIAKLKERYQQIMASKPKLTASETDKLAAFYADTATKIQEGLFTETQMKKKLADAHKEAARMTKPCIKLSPDGAKIAEDNGVRITKDGMVSRNDASRLFKMAGAYLDQETNVESLRKS